MINEINKIKEEYNAVELQQRDRLIALFKLLEARQNYRRVAFSNGDVWSNCWQGGRPDLRQDAAIAHLVHTITHLVPGEPMPSKAPELLPPPAPREHIRRRNVIVLSPNRGRSENEAF